MPPVPTLPDQRVTNVHFELEQLTVTTVQDLPATGCCGQCHGLCGGACCDCAAEPI